MVNDTTLVLVAIVVAALGLLGLVVAETIHIYQQQQAFARGSPISSPAINASQVRCFHRLPLLFIFLDNGFKVKISHCTVQLKL
jgi:hypothetical protein